jgi:pimeloyl-ACP methyl ester carboxylesterase
MALKFPFRRHSRLILVKLVAVLCWAPLGAGAVEPCLKGERCRTVVPVVEAAGIPVYALWPVGAPSDRITRVVFVIHGQKRNAGPYFRRMVRAAEKADALDSTQVIAPRFMIASDGPAEGVLHWARGSDWKEGSKSDVTRGTSMSSFAVLDRLRARLSQRDLYPNLTQVVIAGHSAGGQVAQRYALGTRASPAEQGPGLRFVVANPSSYMYLDARRPDGNGGYAVARGTPGCLINGYKYGAEGRNAYMARAPLADMIRRYRSRDVVYLLGAKDNDPASSSLDKRCPAMAQGPHRLARGRNFMAYLERFFSPHNHRLRIVPGVAHSSSRIFRSEAGIGVLFRR